MIPNAGRMILGRGIRLFLVGILRRNNSLGSLIGTDAIASGKATPVKVKLPVGLRKGAS
jgi:hypothetical protein